MKLPAKDFTNIYQMNKPKLLLTFLALISLSMSSQINMGGLSGLAGGLKDKAKQKLKESTSDAIDKKLEKSRQQFDETNFNWAISFADNSGLFETKENGSRATNAFKNTRDFLKQETKSEYDKGYGANGRGEIFLASNEYKIAETSFLNALIHYKLADSTNSLAYAQTLNNLGLVYQYTGRYHESQKYLEPAIKIREERIKNSIMHGVSLNNMAVMYKEAGKFNEAEKYIGLASNALNAGGHQATIGYALVLNNRAMLYHATGRLDKAEATMKQALEVARQILKETYSNYIKLKINLAYIYRDEKKYAEAEALFLEAIKIKEKKLGASHPDYAHLKRGLADLYMDMGKKEEVEKNLSTACNIYKTKFGDKHPATLATQQDLASFYRTEGKKEKALEMMNSAITISKEIYGLNHPQHVKAIENLALAQWANDKNDEAAANFTTVITKTTEYIDEYFASLSEVEKTKFWDKITPRFHRFNSFVMSNYEKDKSLLSTSFNNQIHNKALLLNSSSKVRNQVLQSNDADLIETYYDWQSAKEQLGRAYSLSNEEVKNEGINIDSLETKTEQLEKKLATKSTLFNESKEKKVSFSDVVSKLNADEALVEIIQVNKFDLKFTGKTSYLVLITNVSGNIDVVNLEDGNNIENFGINNYRTKIQTIKPDNESFALLWEPIEKKLGGKKKVYVSPDGIYNQVSLLTLKDANNKYLIDKYSVVLLGNTKDIIKIKNSGKGNVLKTAYLLGFPTYGTDDIIAALPGTKKEVENLSKILKAAKYNTEVVMNDKATEESAKGANAEVIHFATHGFFLADVDEVEADKVLGVETSNAKKNPLLRSGLMLANCEKVFDETGESLGANNGILTAYEVMNMSLEKTDLVVLSACETGLGQIKQGEGVYGLQRSFLVAGAKSIIMSLWEVSDDATMELMTNFYTNYVKSGNKQEAFLLAQKAIKTKYKEPFYWGAFVLIGN